jgi:hypothetical protein
MTASIDSRATFSNPLQSKYTGTLTIFLADPDTGKTYLNFNSTLQGQTAGSPNDGVQAFFQQAQGLFNTVDRAELNHATTRLSSAISSLLLINGNFDASIPGAQINGSLGTSEQLFTASPQPSTRP